MGRPLLEEELERIRTYWEKIRRDDNRSLTVLSCSEREDLMALLRKWLCDKELDESALRDSESP